MGRGILTCAVCILEMVFPIISVMLKGPDCAKLDLRESNPKISLSELMECCRTISSSLKVKFTSFLPELTAVPDSTELSRSGLMSLTAAGGKGDIDWVMGLEEVLDRLLSWISVCSMLTELVLIWSDEDRLNTMHACRDGEGDTVSIKCHHRAMDDRMTRVQYSTVQYSTHLMADWRLGEESL